MVSRPRRSGAAIVTAFGADGANASAFLSSVVNNNGTITFSNDFNPEHPSDPKSSKSFRLTVTDTARDYVAEETADADAKLEIVGIPGKDLVTAAGASTELTVKEPAAWGNPPEYSRTLAISPALPTEGQYNRIMMYPASSSQRITRRVWFDDPQRQIKYSTGWGPQRAFGVFSVQYEYIHTGNHNFSGNNVTFWVHGTANLPTHPPMESDTCCSNPE